MEFGNASPEQWLRNVGYYRLSGYWYPYRVANRDKPHQRLDGFQPGTCFDDIVLLYEFDRKLRTLLHDGIERVEVALRTVIGHHIGSIDPLAYFHATTFRPSFKHARWISTALSRVSRSYTHSKAIRHHYDNYNGSLPIWVLTDYLDFSDISRLYDGLRSMAQWDLAEELGVKLELTLLSKNQQQKAKKSHPLARWFEQLTIVRNTCAHHSRVWNISFTPASTTALQTRTGLESLPVSQSEKLYGSIVMIDYLLKVVSPGSTWSRKVNDLVIESFIPLGGRSPDEMGFPINWQIEQPWKQRMPDAAEPGKSTKHNDQ